MYGVCALGEKTGFGPMRAVIAAKTLIILATFLLVGLFAYKRSQSLVLAILFAVVAAAIARRTFHPRPPVITYLMIAFFHFVLAAYRAGKLRAPFLYVLPLLMALWANLHGGFILGGIVIFFFFFGEVVEAIWKKWICRSRNAEWARASYKRARTLFAIGVLTGICSLTTPFGWRLYLLTYRVMSETSLVQQIAELQPPNYKYMWAFPVLSCYLGIAMLLQWRRVFIGEALWFVLLFHQSFHHMRHLPLFAIATAPLAAELSVAIWRWLARDRMPVQRSIEIGLAVLTIGLSGWWLTHHREVVPGRGPVSYLEHAIDLASGRAYRVQDYPVRLCDFIEDTGFDEFPGRMFNDSRYAGYLIWRFSPEKHQVFTDMRYDIFGDDFLIPDLAGRKGMIKLVDENDDVVEVVKWRDVYDEWGVNFAVLDKLEGVHHNDPSQGVIAEMNRSNDWIKVYDDKPGYPDGLAVYLRITDETKPLVKRCREMAPYGAYRRPGCENFGR
jgi:hypothetical protein